MSLSSSQGIRPPESGQRQKTGPPRCPSSAGGVEGTGSSSLRSHGWMGRLVHTVFTAGPRIEPPYESRAHHARRSKSTTESFSSFRHETSPGSWQEDHGTHFDPAISELPSSRPAFRFGAPPGIERDSHRVREHVMLDTRRRTSVAQTMLPNPPEYSFVERAPMLSSGTSLAGRTLSRLTGRNGSFLSSFRRVESGSESTAATSQTSSKQPGFSPRPSRPFSWGIFPTRTQSSSMVARENTGGWQRGPDQSLTR